MSERPDFHEAAQDFSDAWHNLLRSVIDALAPVLVPLLKALVRLLDWLDDRLGR